MFEVVSQTIKEENSLQNQIRSLDDLSLAYLVQDKFKYENQSGKCGKT